MGGTGRAFRDIATPLSVNTRGRTRPLSFARRHAAVFDTFRKLAICRDFSRCAPVGAPAPADRRCGPGSTRERCYVCAMVVAEGAKAELAELLELAYEPAGLAAWRTCDSARLSTRTSEPVSARAAGGPGGVREQVRREGECLDEPQNGESDRTRISNRAANAGRARNAPWGHHRLLAAGASIISHRNSACP